MRNRSGHGNPSALRWSMRLGQASLALPRRFGKHVLIDLKSNIIIIFCSEHDEYVHFSCQPPQNIKSTTTVMTFLVEKYTDVNVKRV